MVRQVVGHDQRQVEIHTRVVGRTSQHPLQGRLRRGGALPAQQSRQPPVRRQVANPRRKPLAQLQRGRLARGRPLSHIDREHQPRGQPLPRAQEAHRLALRLRAEARPHSP